MTDGAAEITLEGGNKECSNDACECGSEQENAEVTEQTLPNVMGDIKLDPLRDEWPLK
ncbi:hypothetical protein BH160DRAFT_6486 [Burkholderia sp. H160]|nr:hypothetical protein BH160DRAFT_6486 [Burkholderia sp. H160]